LNKLVYTLYNNNDVFYLNQSKLYLNQTLDFDAANSIKSFILNISIYDTTNAPTFANMTINIANINDNVPIFIESGLLHEVTENVVNNTFIGSITATDADVGDQISYVIVNANC